MKTVSLKVEMKCSCFYKTENNCVKMTNRKRQNWLSATTSPSSRRQITFSCSVYWSVSVCFQDTQEDVLCLQMQKHTARSCSHTHRHIHRQTHTMPRGGGKQWVGRGKENKNWTVFIFIYIQLREGLWQQLQREKVGSVCGGERNKRRHKLKHLRPREMQSL